METRVTLGVLAILVLMACLENLDPLGIRDSLEPRDPQVTLESQA